MGVDYFGRSVPDFTRRKYINRAVTFTPQLPECQSPTLASQPSGVGGEKSTTRVAYSGFLQRYFLIAHGRIVYKRGYNR